MDPILLEMQLQCGEHYGLCIQAARDGTDIQCAEEFVSLVSHLNKSPRKHMLPEFVTKSFEYKKKQCLAVIDAHCESDQKELIRRDSLQLLEKNLAKGFHAFSSGNQIEKVINNALRAVPHPMKREKKSVLIQGNR